MFSLVLLIIYFASFSGIKKLPEATWLLADQRRDWIQDGAILHSDSGLLQHPVFLIQLQGQQASNSNPEERHTHLTVYALWRLCKGKLMFSPACNFRTCLEILVNFLHHITPSKLKVLLLCPGCQQSEAARIVASLQALRLAGQAFGRGSEGDVHAPQLPLWLLHPMPGALPWLNPV